LSSIPKFHYQLQNSLKERNFFGIGHQLDYTHRSSDGSANNLAYTIPNIRNTFVKTLFKYQNDLDKYEKHSSGTTFLFPLAKWAGGIYLGQQFRKDTLQGADLAM
jgi:hypothetical protein